MDLAVFDLDHTLLDGDSDYLWGQFLVEQGRVDGERYERENQRFYQQYLAGSLDIEEFARFSLAPLATLDITELNTLRRRFILEKIAPRVAHGTPHLLEQHRARGDTLLITTATNRFITEPIAELLQIGNLLATEPEMVDGRYTGRIAGHPNFREGKVLRLRQWLEHRSESYAHIVCYSDSHNDLPLLCFADRAVAVDPDPRLHAEAQRRDWPVISLRRAAPLHNELAVD